VLTIHSPFSVENVTSHPLQLTLHLQRADPARFGSGGGGGGGSGGGRGGGAVCAVPAAGALAPGEQCFLPLPAVWCAGLPCKLLLKECNTVTYRTAAWQPLVLNKWSIARSAKPVERWLGQRGGTPDPRHSPGTPCLCMCFA